jgi:hypothetical protein
MEGLAFEGRAGKEAERAKARARPEASQALARGLKPWARGAG